MGLEKNCCPRRRWGKDRAFHTSNSIRGHKVLAATSGRSTTKRPWP